MDWFLKQARRQTGRGTGTGRGRDWPIVLDERTICGKPIRASSSIALNIAEGAGEFSPKEKARFYRMARRSATECAAILDVCRRLALLGEDAHLASRELLLRIVSMLVSLIKSQGD